MYTCIRDKQENEIMVLISNDIPRLFNRFPCSGLTVSKWKTSKKHLFK